MLSNTGIPIFKAAFKSPCKPSVEKIAEIEQENTKLRNAERNGISMIPSMLEESNAARTRYLTERHRETKI